MAIRGRLEHLKLFMVFRSILEKKMTGVLTLQSAEGHRGEGTGPIIKRAEVLNGTPVRTASNQRRDGLVFALVDEGLISSTEEVALREQAQQTRTPIDVMAQQMGLVAPRRLQAIQRRVARQLLIEPFTWSDGLYQFEDAPVRADAQGQGVDLIEILLEAAARTVGGETANLFVTRYAQQFICPTEQTGAYAQRFDALFPLPNVRSALEAGPAQFEAVARQRGDRRAATQEVAALVLSGLARFQLDAPRLQDSTPPDEPARPVIAIRRATAPANLSGSGAPAPGPEPPATRPVARPDAPPPPRRAETPPEPPPVRKASAPVPVSAAAPGRTASAAANPMAVGGKPPPDEKTAVRVREARERVATLETKTHYEVLGVPNNAEAEILRNAFRALAREFHADRFARFALDPADQAAVQKYFIAINRASEVLSNPQTRAEYDAGLAMGVKGGAQSAAGGPDINKIFRAEKLVREAVNLIRNGAFDTARDRLAEALAITPDDPLGQAAMAYVEFMLAQARGGAPRPLQTRTVEVLSQVTAGMGEGGREEPFYYLGRVFVLLGQPERATQALMRAIKINPHCTEAVSELRHLQRKPEKKEGPSGPQKKA